MLLLINSPGHACEAGINLLKQSQVWHSELYSHFVEVGYSRQVGFMLTICKTLIQDKSLCPILFQVNALWICKPRMYLQTHNVLTWVRFLHSGLNLGMYFHDGFVCSGFPGHSGFADVKATFMHATVSSRWTLIVAGGKVLPIQDGLNVCGSHTQ